MKNDLGTADATKNQDFNEFTCGGMYTSAEAQDVPPTIETLTLRIRHKIEVRGRTSARSGTVYALASDGVWKGITEVLADGTFSNPNLPESYLYKKDEVLVRVGNSPSSREVLATNGFVHSRSLPIYATPTPSDDREFYQSNMLWADHQPTGYWLPSDTSLSIWLEGDDSATYAHIGLDGLADFSDRTKPSPGRRVTQLKRGENQLPKGEGGLIHISNNGKSTCRVILGPESVPVPFFRLGPSDSRDWRPMLENAKQTPIQLVGDRLVITCYRDTYNLYATLDPAHIIERHQTLLEIQAKASGFYGDAPIHTRSPLWIHTVESVSSKNPHAGSGYIGLPHSTHPDSQHMQAMLNKPLNLWVTLHEYGHHFQTRTATVSPMFGERVPNIYALAVGRLHENNYSEEFPTRWLKLKEWLALPREKKNYLESPDSQAIFEQLRKGFGDYFLPKWDRYNREYPSPKNDLMNFTKSLSIVADCNLAAFFADWGVIKEQDDVWKMLYSLGLDEAPTGLTDLPPYEKPRSMS